MTKEQCIGCEEWQELNNDSLCESCFGKREENVEGKRGDYSDQINKESDMFR